MAARCGSSQPRRTSPARPCSPRRNACSPGRSTPRSADPQPSTTVDIGDLDVLQANAAAAVAGHDRLVLVVGPAGAGKTSALRSAVADLAAQRRPVFGVAPSAKAARVLERDAGCAPTPSPSCSTNGNAATGHRCATTCCRPARR